MQALLADVSIDQDTVDQAFSACCKELRDDPFQPAAVKFLDRMLEKSAILDRAKFFTSIYETGTWQSGESDAVHQSEPRSNGDNSAPYKEFVGNFVKEKSINSVVDLGCGDYRVSGSIDWHGAGYIGVDIVEDLVNQHNKDFGNSIIQFIAADMVEDDLPPGELCLVRQALQHMSNKDVLKVIAKLGQYKFVLITDGQADIPEDRRRNLDMPAGHSTRALLYGNGLWLELAPFNLNISTALQYIIPIGDSSGEVLRTVLLSN